MTVLWPFYSPKVPIQVGMYLVASVFRGVKTLVEVFEYEDQQLFGKSRESRWRHVVYIKMGHATAVRHLRKWFQSSRYDVWGPK